MFNFFTPPSRAGDQWFSVGLASSFPDLGQDEEAVEALSKPRPCGGIESKPGCKAFHVPKTDSSKSKEVPVNPADGDTGVESSDIGPPPLEEQVLVFRYKGTFHAVDHVSWFGTLEEGSLEIEMC